MVLFMLKDTNRNNILAAPAHDVLLRESLVYFTKTFPNHILDNSTIARLFS